MTIVTDIDFLNGARALNKEIRYLLICFVLLFCKVVLIDLKQMVCFLIDEYWADCMGSITKAVRNIVDH